jgi:hypothetical protein
MAIALSTKLQVREGQSIRVINAPDRFDLGPPATDDDDADAIVLFVRNRAELEALGDPAVEAARRDRLTWIAYPKAGQLDTDLSRDTLRDLALERGIQPVRQVSIDGVWSALRFRPA